MEQKTPGNGLLPQDGFQRLVDHIKREHTRLRKVQDPQIKSRTRKIEKYQEQRDLNDSPEMKKGLQLKTAA